MSQINNLESLLSSNDTNGSIIELDNIINELCSYGDELDKLSDLQKLFYYNQCLEREINNGGFNQYFFNSSGDYAHQTTLSLRTIGANTTADILQKAIDQFPGNDVPQDRAVRQELLEQIQDKANPVWEELDQKFYAYEDDLNTMNLNYIRQHKTDF